MDFLRKDFLLSPLKILYAEQKLQGKKSKAFQS